MVDNGHAAITAVTGLLARRWKEERPYFTLDGDTPSGWPARVLATTTPPIWFGAALAPIHCRAFLAQLRMDFPPPALCATKLLDIGALEHLLST